MDRLYSAWRDAGIVTVDACGQSRGQAQVGVGYLTRVDPAKRKQIYNQS